MLNSKKWLALCATGLVGFGVVAPTATSAFAAQKVGNTTLTYQTSKPAEWGLSVPSSIKLDQKSTGTAVLNYDNAKLAIVNEDGSNFTDKQVGHVFNVSGISSVLDSSDNSKAALSNPKKATVRLYLYPLNQGVAPTSKVTWNSENDAAVSRLRTLTITTDPGNSQTPERYVQFAVNTQQANQLAGTDSTTLSDTISWTATETLS